MKTIVFLYTDHKQPVQYLKRLINLDIKFENLIFIRIQTVNFQLLNYQGGIEASRILKRRSTSYKTEFGWIARELLKLFVKEPNQSEKEQNINYDSFIAVPAVYLVCEKVDLPTLFKIYLPDMVISTSSIFEEVKIENLPFLICPKL